MKESEDVPVVLCGDLDCVGFGGRSEGDPGGR